MHRLITNEVNQVSKKTLLIKAHGYGFTAVLLCLFCSICASLFIFAFAPAPSAEAADVFSQSLVSVGSGYVIADADIGVVSFAIETTAAEAGAAHQLNLETIERISQAMQAADIPGLKLVVRQPSIWPKTSLISKETQYTASAGLDVHTSDITLVGRVADIGLQNGANSIQNIRFDLSDLTQVRQKALEEAVMDAIAKAKVMSDAAGLKVVTVRELRDANDIQVHNPSALQASGTATGTSQSAIPMALTTPIYRGQVIVMATVTVVFDVIIDKTKDVLGLSTNPQ